MPKTSLSSLELAAVVNELQPLNKAKITTIYQFDREFLWELHLSGQGKKLLRIVPGKLLCLTNKKDPSTKLTEFCRQLRRWLEGGIIVKLEQKEAERIVVMEVQKISPEMEKLFVIIELFSKGNIVVADKSLIILTLLEQQEWKDRAVKRGQPYQFPKPGINWKQITREELGALICKSGKRNLVTALATELGLGGLYAEELCLVAQVDKTIPPTLVNPPQITSLHRALTHFQNLIALPQGYLYAEEITPFPLANQKPLGIILSYAEAVETIIPFPKASLHQARISQLQHTIAQQEAAIVEQEQALAENKRQGELLYEHYQEIQQLLTAVHEWKQEQGWEKAGQELLKLSNIKEINLKEKKVFLQL